MKFLLRHKRLFFYCCLVFAIIQFFLPIEIFATETDHSTSHGDEFADNYLIFFVIISCAVSGRYIARLLKQSEVLGELVMGIIVGGILFSLNVKPLQAVRYNDTISKVIDTVQHDHELDMEHRISTINNMDMPKKDKEIIIQLMESENFRHIYAIANQTMLLSSLGVLLLLFVVGLETSIVEMKKVGKNSLIVAFLGILFPFLLGYLFIEFGLKDLGLNQNVAVFVGATIGATSIGITARVFQDMKTIEQHESKIVLGAAVIDDVLGLLVLAIFSGVVVTGGVDFYEISLIVIKAILFFVIVYFFGTKLLKKNIKWFAKFDQQHIALLYPFGFLMIMAYLADLVGLASIVGAFVAGLVLKDEYFEDYYQESESSIERIIAPIEGILAPIFFVIMGFQVDITTFTDFSVLGIGLLLTILAIIGKLCSTFFLPKDVNKWIVGFGMVPRGEVGLIFASIGREIGVLDSNMFSIVIIVVILSTVITPPALSVLYRLQDKKK